MAGRIHSTRVEWLLVFLLLVVPAAWLTAQTQVSNATVVPAKKGELRVPGRAFLDGRDLEANPVSTLLQIPLWESPAQKQTVCKAGHGTAVDLVEVQRSVAEEKYYFRIKTPICEGWVAESDLSAKKMPATGVTKKSSR
jgi:hypothetical protein